MKKAEAILKLPRPFLVGSSELTLEFNLELISQTQIYPRQTIPYR